MRLPPFQYLEPGTITEALSMMGMYTDTVKVVAGGTEAIAHLKLRLISPTYVMNIKKIRDMTGIYENEKEIIIGANTTLKEIADSALIKDKCKAIGEAASQVASPTIAAMGTIGGNILQNTRCMSYDQSEIVLKGFEPCYKRGGKVCLAVKGSKRCFSVYQGDMAPAVIAFDGKCVLEKKGSIRTVPVTDLFTGNGIKPFSIGSDEILTKVIIPKQSEVHGSAFRKLRIRGSVDYALASAAALITVTADKKISTGRIVIGAAGPAPRIVDGATELLQGKLPQETDVEAMAEMAFALSEGMDNLTMPGAYRRKMVGVFTKRAIQGAFEDMKRGM
jgi:4-hydroxybenzoyl-CoA reductase subunit beta